MRARRLCVALLGAMLLAAGPAAALGDLTGVYEGPLVCEWTEATGSFRASTPGALHVDDDGAGNAYLYLNNSGQVFRAAVVSGPDEPGRGRLGGPSCGFSPSTGGWLIQASARAKPGSEKASLKGEFVIVGVGAASHLVMVCRLSMKRTSPTIAQPISCP